MRSELPMILKFLQEKAGVAIHFDGEERGLALYKVDLVSWRLRFSDETPFIVVKEKDAQDNLERVWNAIFELVDVHTWESSLPILIVEGVSEGLRRKVALARETYFTMAVLDDETAERMSAETSCRYAMLDALLTQIPRRNLLPYETAAPVVGSAFFGRQTEVRRLTQDASSYAITGVRRIGKTSLLLEARRRIQRKENDLFFICSTLHSQEDFVREIIRALRPTELRHLSHHLFNFADFLRRMPQFKKGRITLFLDEVDQLIEIDREAGYTVFNALRDARTATEGGWRFVFAGSTTLQDECADLSSPLYNMVRLMPLEPFQYQQVRALVHQPLETVRISIKNSTDVVSRIYRETGGHPNLIQHYCVLLADLVDQEKRDFIEPGDLGEVYASTAFRSYVLRAFQINTGPMEQLIVYLMARRQEFTQNDIDEALKQADIVVPFVQINEACDNLEKVAVFSRVGRSYQFSLPLLPAMLEHNYDLDYLVTKAREELRQ